MHALLNLLAPVLDPIVHLDFAIVQFFNQFANKSIVLDRAVALVEEMFLLKGALFMAAMYWLWFLPSDDIDRDRIRILRGLAGTMVAIAVTLTLDHFLPNRPRPLNEPSLGFILPTGSYDTPVADNSFPSDHGAMFFAVSTIIWLRSRPMGIVAYIYTVIMVFLPRIYAGHHYPSDIVAGCAIGAFFVWAALDRSAAGRAGRVSAPLGETPSLVVLRRRVHVHGSGRIAVLGLADRRARPEGIAEALRLIAPKPIRTGAASAGRDRSPSAGSPAPPARNPATAAAATS